ncbi:hypothetical protein Atai01_35170 [Amycolatopsis taiwanensis]|uniref:Uncharacterized protein n=1 Tax=Amycolatopsis taiwanensis TaxID=342230 RepID=A0A9W6R1W8_9PSEU|nr:hypothetical protein Atai01_35170 [Amycolatopsis taiwanensis]
MTKPLRGNDFLTAGGDEQGVTRRLVATRIRADQYLRLCVLFREFARDRVLWGLSPHTPTGGKPPDALPCGGSAPTPPTGGKPPDPLDRVDGARVLVTLIAAT